MLDERYRLGLGKGIEVLDLSGWVHVSLLAIGHLAVRITLVEDEQPAPDLMFLDILLSDGLCFESIAC